MFQKTEAEGFFEIEKKKFLAISNHNKTTTKTEYF